MYRPPGADLDGKLHVGTTATKPNNVTGHQVAALSLLTSSASIHGPCLRCSKNIFTWRLPASHLALILLWNKIEAISFLLLNGLLLMLLTYEFFPC